MRHCVIIAGGDLPGRITVPEGALVLCADCGLRHALAQGIRPDVLIGDFDSYTQALPEGIPVLRLPVEKDVTDTMRAVQYGREQGCRTFEIYGVFGGERIDHSIANLQMLHTMAAQGLHGTLHHGQTTVTVQMPGTVRYPAYRGSFSLFALTETCGDVTIRGTKYNAAHLTLQSSFPLGVSNSITGDCAEVTLGSGILLVVQVPE